MIKRGTTFADKVREYVRAIPRGETRSYKQVATAAGSPGAARAVGSIMSSNVDMSIPCHRVVRSDGKVTGYNGLQGKSRETLLRQEGAIV